MAYGAAFREANGMNLGERITTMGDNRKLSGTISIKVAENITVENLVDIIGRIGGLTGCRPCGILGIDLRLSGDPVESEQLAKLPGVKSVSFGE